MNKHDYDAHPVWQGIKNVEAALDVFRDEAKADERFFELEKKIGYLRWTLEKSEPFLFSTTELKQLAQHLQHIKNHLTNNANGWRHTPQIEQFFTHIYLIVSYPRIQKIFKTDANTFFEKCESDIRAVKTNADDTLRELQESSDILEAALAETKETLANIDEDVETSDTKIEAQFEHWETKLNTEITEKLGELSELFATGQDKRREEHEAQLSKITTTLREAQANTDKTLSVNKMQISEAKETLQTFQSEITDEAKELLGKINEIYGIAGNTALSGDFAKAAESEVWAYWVATFFAAIFYILIPASFAYFWLNYIDVTAFQLSDLLIRLPISAVFLAPAIYFGNLAQKHRRVAISFRSLGIRIATFDAYLANFTQSEKNEAKKQMAEVFFDAKISVDNKPSISNKDLGKALDQVVDPLGKIAGMFGVKS